MYVYMYIYKTQLISTFFFAIQLIPLLLSHISHFQIYMIKTLDSGDMSFYSVVEKLYNVSANIDVVLSSLFSGEARVVPRKVLRAESFLMFLWDKLINREIPPVVFLQTVTHLKMFDTNEQAAFDEHDIDSDDDAYYVEE